MKLSGLRVAFISIISLVITAVSLADTYGLFVGVAKYQEIVSNGKRTTNDLKGPVNDVIKAKAVYTKTLGIASKNITTLVNSKANGAGLVEGFQTILGKLSPGDTFVFYFSGHGATLKAPGGGEKSIQALVMHDYMVLDNESLGNIRKTLVGAGIRTVFILDSCYAGGMDRPLPGLVVNNREFKVRSRLLTEKLFPKNKPIRKLSLKHAVVKSKAKVTPKFKAFADAGSILFLSSQTDQRSIDLGEEETKTESRGLFSLFFFDLLEANPKATAGQLLSGVESKLKRQELITLQRPRLVLYGSATRDSILFPN